MRLAEFKSIGGKLFALNPNNIKEVCSNGEYTTISTYDNTYDCKFPLDHTIAIINNALTDNHQYITTTHRFPSCARN